MILAEDEIGLGSDHSGIMLLPDGIEPGTPLADVLPVHEQVLDVTPTLNRVDLLSMVGLAREVATLFDGDLLEIEVDDPAIVHPEWVDVTVDDPGGMPALPRPGVQGRHRRTVADVAAGTPSRSGNAIDLERRRRDELRHARVRKPSARLRPGRSSTAAGSPSGARARTSNCARSTACSARSTRATW